MSAMRSVPSYDLCNLHGNRTSSRSHHDLLPGILLMKNSHPYAKHGLLLFNTNPKKHVKCTNHMGFHIANEIHQLASSGPSSPQWPNWIWAVFFSVFLPFLKNKWGPLEQLKNQVHRAIQTVEMVTEAVEEIAEKVEEVAEEVAEKLPDDVKLKDAILRVEDLAQEALKDAKAAEVMIHKVEEAENKLEELLESGSNTQEQNNDPKTD